MPDGSQSAVHEMEHLLESNPYSASIRGLLILEHVSPEGGHSAVRRLIGRLERDVNVEIGVEEHRHIGQGIGDRQMFDIRFDPDAERRDTRPASMAELKERSNSSAPKRFQIAPCIPCGSCLPGGNRSATRT